MVLKFALAMKILTAVIKEGGKDKDIMTRIYDKDIMTG